MKALYITLLLVLTFSLMASPNFLTLNYTDNIELISSEVELHQFLIHHKSNAQNSASIMFSTEDIGNARIEVFNILGKLLYSADVYLSENSYDYIIDNEFYASSLNPGILLVKLTTKENQYLKKFTLIV